MVQLCKAPAARAKGVYWGVSLEGILESTRSRWVCNGRGISCRGISLLRPIHRKHIRLVDGSEIDLVSLARRC